MADEIRNEETQSTEATEVKAEKKPRFSKKAKLIVAGALSLLGAAAVAGVAYKRGKDGDSACDVEPVGETFEAVTDVITEATEE